MSDDKPRELNRDPVSGWRIFLLCGGIAALSLGGYLIASAVISGLGFPLDDAWIHQAYAKNLGLRGEFAFLPGRPSAGSTSPVWAILLAVGYILRVEPRFWAYLVGWLLLSGLAYTGFRGLRVLAPSRPAWAVWGGVLLGLEWHLVWAAGSGMETLLAALLVTIVLLWLSTSSTGGWGLGLLIGLGAWIRPDLVTLLGPAGLALLLKKGSLSGRLRQGLFVLAGFAALFLPYLLFNDWIAGTIWPNTFYAKQAEYAVLQQIPLAARYLSELRLPLIGVGIVLLPGAVNFVRIAWSRRAWGQLTGVVWWLSYLGMYAMRLPVTYQHGRYVMPAMPIFFLWGAAGLVLWLRPVEPILWRRVTGRAWSAVAGIILISFYGIGAQGYANDVGFIETEMVRAARWIAANTAPEALIAAHDIGALGYFGGRDLLDMAGLVSPEVIPFIRDQSQLHVFLDSNGVEYLVTFPSWYPDLVNGAQPIYQTDGEFGPRLGSENMAVYGWPLFSP